MTRAYSLGYMLGWLFGAVATWLFTIKNLPAFDSVIVSVFGSAIIYGLQYKATAQGSSPRTVRATTDRENEG